MSSRCIEYSPVIVPIIRRGSEYVFPPIRSIVPSGIVNSARIDVIFSVFIVFN